jgi:hypothetical protein
VRVPQNNRMQRTAPASRSAAADPGVIRTHEGRDHRLARGREDYLKSHDVSSNGSTPSLVGTPPRAGWALVVLFVVLHVLLATKISTLGPRRMPQAGDPMALWVGLGRRSRSGAQSLRQLKCAEGVEQPDAADEARDALDCRGLRS